MSLVTLGAPLSTWRASLEDSASSLSEHLAAVYGEDDVELWRARYLQIVAQFEQRYGVDGGDVVISRCPGQMNIMGMHIDYGGMPSLRLAVKGHDTITVIRQRTDDLAQLSSRYEGEEGERDFEATSFSVRDLAAPEPLGDGRQALMEYAGQICTKRERETGSTIDTSWSILPQGQLVYLDSWLRGRGRELTGLDAYVHSNVSPSGGMSSSSALVISTAYAALGLYGVVPGKDISWEDAIDVVSGAQPCVSGRDRWRGDLRMDSWDTGRYR
mgnify:FL=1